MGSCSSVPNSTSSEQASAAVSNNMEGSAGYLDDGLYSRQKIMLGEEAMKRMAQSSVFLSGLGGLGVEIAKNIALAGVKALTLHDSTVATWLDLSTQFYLSPSNLGKNRAEVSLPSIAQLNPYTKVSLSNADLRSVDLAFFDQFKCVILTDAPLDVQLRINDHCHANGIRFIAADVRGALAWGFTDFGAEFEIFDATGEEPREMLIDNVTQASEGVVTVLDNGKHGLEDGNAVTFREVLGAVELNGSVHKVKVLSPSSFTIGDTSGIGKFKPGKGIAVQVKLPLKVSYAPLREALDAPELAIADFAKLDAPAQLHCAQRALSAFVQAHGHLPRPWNGQDATEVLAAAEKLNETATGAARLEKVDADVVRRLAYTSQGSIVPLTAFMGGVMAQETLKALSGKYTPLRQWLYFDASEVVPSLDTPAAFFQPRSGRDDAQRIVLGEETTAKLANLKLFMIGCGAIGCEMLKNFAMLGVSTGPEGQVTITDNDLIEKSNLNRQFLFRNSDLQKPKSETAARAATSMNAAMKVTPLLDKVGPDTEAKFNDTFFSGLDIVVNALDNINARIYVDGRCVTCKKPLLESGTLGPKGHVQVVVPYKTESYASQRDPPEADVPFCTLKSFPNLIEHTIEWARDFSFGGLFVAKPMQWNQLADENDLLQKLAAAHGGGLDMKVVRTAAKLLERRPRSFDDCIVFARLKFESYFVNKARQLLHSFPLDHVTDDKGTLFWSSPKRPPREIPFDFNDPIHSQFVISLANLWAEVWGLPHSADVEHIKKVVESVKVPPFVPKSGKKIETDQSVGKEEALKKQQEEELSADEVMAAQLKSLHRFFTSGEHASKLKPIDFEKDDDTNFHIDFISSTANLRARNYSIPEVERLKIKAIAGRIMPAIATTTAAVSGIVALELIKLAKGIEVEHHKNLFMNLALPLWAFSEPGPAQRKKITSKFSYTLWDRWDIQLGDCTLGDFLTYFEKTYGLKVGGVFNGAIMVYVSMMPMHAKRKPNKMSMLLKRKPADKYIDLIVTFLDETDTDVSGPPIRFHYA
eukprot:TRINITY_DN2271_c0_g2_i1.p1 TRINITY_DN2271_c0_g2~~TRINITY_DN2271_c0_g2_i1.p1  ORF type:complete len:1039 (-),score=398.38 TRINITY_DN2271_c0_g2_i1:311-3427(-)